MTDWSELDTWWQRELSEDPSYAAEVEPLFRELAAVDPGQTILDLGTGTGWVLEKLREQGAEVVGVELNSQLARKASRRGPVIVSNLPDLSWCREEAFDGITAVLVLEHLPELDSLFGEAARVTRADGSFTLVVNHPQITAPGSAPVVDPVDGEVYWRWGDYLQSGSTQEPAGEDTVTFHHRPIADLLNAAAGAGWILEKLVERGLPDSLAEGDPLLELQKGLPRLLGVRWRRA